MSNTKGPRTKAAPGGAAVSVTPAEPAGRAVAPEGDNEDYGEMLNLADREIRRVVTDKRVWTEEAARRAAALLPWPLIEPEDGYEWWLRALTVATVENLVEARAQKRGCARLMPQGDELLSPSFQQLLRVAKRAVDAADSKISRRFAGTGKLSGKRDFMNWLKEYRVGELVTSGPGFETYSATCRNGENVMVRCELGGCRTLK